MVKWWKHTSWSLWQIAAGIHQYVSTANCCRHTSICLYGKLLQAYINMSLCQIAAGIHQYVSMANCCRHTSLCLYDKLLQADINMSLWQIAGLLLTQSLGYRNHFSWQMFPVYCSLKCLWGTETGEKSLMKITYSSSLFHMTNKGALLPSPLLPKVMCPRILKADAAHKGHIHRLLLTLPLLHCKRYWQCTLQHNTGSVCYSVTMAVCAAVSIYLHCQCYIVTYTASIILLHTTPVFYMLLNSYIHWDRRGRRPQSWWRRYCSAWPGWRPPDKTCPRLTWPQNCWHGTCTQSLITVLVHSLSCPCTCTHSLPYQGTSTYSMS